MSASCLTTRNRSSSTFVLLQRVDIKVNRGVGGGQQMTKTGHVGQPARPLSQNLGCFSLITEMTSQPKNVFF